LRNHVAFGELPSDRYVVPGPWQRLGRPVKHDVESWRVIDDWRALGIGQLHRILTRTTYIGRHEFNKRSKARN
jgi:hypothetical protein